MPRPRCSKWKGPIRSAGRQRSIVQRTINVGVPSDTAVLGYTDLTASEQTITTGITNPDVYRVLKVKRGHSTGEQTFTIIGTNFAGATITDVQRSLLWPVAKSLRTRRARASARCGFLPGFH